MHIKRYILMVAQDTTNQQITPYKAYLITHINQWGGMGKEFSKRQYPIATPSLHTHHFFNGGRQYNMLIYLTTFNYFC